MNNENEQLQKEVQDLRALVERLRQDFTLHIHNGLDATPVKLFLPITFIGASFIDSSIANSGFGSFSIRHTTGAVELQVSGNGEGLGSQQVVMITPAGKQFGLFVDISGVVTVETNVTQFIFTGTGASGGVIRNLKNAAASALSGTQRDIEIDIAGVKYHFTVFPTKA